MSRSGSKSDHWPSPWRSRSPRWSTAVGPPPPAPADVPVDGRVQAFDLDVADGGEARLAFWRPRGRAGERLSRATLDRARATMELISRSTLANGLEIATAGNWMAAALKCFRWCVTRYVACRHVNFVRAHPVPRSHGRRSAPDVASVLPNDRGGHLRMATGASITGSGDERDPRTCVRWLSTTAKRGTAGERQRVE